MSSVEKAHPPDAPWNIVDPSNGTNASTTPDRVALAAHRVGLVPKWGIVSAIKRLFKKNVPPPQQFMSFDDKVAATFVQNALSGIRLSGRPRLKTADLKKLARGLASGGKGLIREKTVQLVAEEKTNARGESMLVVRPKPYKKGERLTEKQYVITKVLPQQIHGIAGVNVHKDPETGKLVADIGMDDLASGSSKRIKNATRIMSEGEVVRIVRHTKTQIDKELGTRPEDTFMCSDEQVEIQIRKDLEGVRGIVPIVEYEYLTESGEYRKRFLSERCDGDLASLIFTKKKGTRGELEPLPEDKRQTKKALRLLCDSCEIFEQFHTKGVAFLDLRLPNILVKSGIPMISDMGSCTHMGVPADARLPGDTEIRPPEVLFATHEQEPKLDKSLDIYAFGLALWEAYDPEGVGAFRAARRVSGGFTKGPEEFRQSDQGFLNVLRATEDPVKSLIADLLALEPTERPKSFGEVRERLDSAIKTLEQKGL